MRRRNAVVVALVATIALSVGASAHAAPALIAIDDASPTLTALDDGGWSGTVTLTNLSTEGLKLSAAPADAAATTCKPTLSRAAFGAAQSADVKLTAPAECKPDGETLDLLITASGTTSQDIRVASEVSAADDEPAWGQLWVFPWALLIAAVAVALTVRFTEYKMFRGELEYLPATYSFKESWISNLTVVAGLLTAVFGSDDVVKAFLGEEADRSIALATVGSAFALALIGAAPIVFTAAKTNRKPDKVLVQVPTVRGLMFASTVAAAGAGGQLWIGWKSGAALDLGGFEGAPLTVVFVIAVLLLLWYTVVTTLATLNAGSMKPPATPKTDLALLSENLEKVLRRSPLPNASIPGVLNDLATTSSYPFSGTSPGDEPYVPPRRNAAML